MNNKSKEMIKSLEKTVDKCSLDYTKKLVYISGYLQCMFQSKLISREEYDIKFNKYKKIYSNLIGI